MQYNRGFFGWQQSFRSIVWIATLVVCLTLRGNKRKIIQQQEKFREFVEPIT